MSDSGEPADPPTRLPRLSAALVRLAFPGSESRSRAGPTEPRYEARLGSSSPLPTTRSHAVLASAVPSWLSTQHPLTPLSHLLLSPIHSLQCAIRVVWAILITCSLPPRDSAFCSFLGQALDPYSGGWRQRPRDLRFLVLRARHGWSLPLNRQRPPPSLPGPGCDSWPLGSWCHCQFWIPRACTDLVQGDLKVSGCLPHPLSFCLFSPAGTLPAP